MDGLSGESNEALQTSDKLESAETATTVREKQERSYEYVDSHSALASEEQRSTTHDKILLVLTLVVFVVVFRDNQALQQTGGADRKQRRQVVEWLVSSAALACHIQLLLTLLLLVPSRVGRTLIAAADMTLVVATLASGLYPTDMSHQGARRRAEQLNNIRIFLDMVALQLVVVVAVRSRHHLLLALTAPVYARVKTSGGRAGGSGGGVPLYALGLLSLFWLSVSLWFLWEWQEARTSWSHDLFGRELQNRAEMFCQVRTGGPLGIGIPHLSLRPHQSFDHDGMSATLACGKLPFHSYLRNGVFRMDCHLNPAVVTEYSSPVPAFPTQRRSVRSTEYRGKPVNSTSSIIRAQCGRHAHYHLQVKADEKLIDNVKQRWIRRRNDLHSYVELYYQKTGYDVLVLAVESVSRLQFYRRFRQTAAALRRLREHRDTNLYQLLRYTMPYCCDRTDGLAVIGGCHFEWSNAWSGQRRDNVDKSKKRKAKTHSESKSKQRMPEKTLLCDHTDLMAEARLAGYLTALVGESCEQDYLDVDRGKLKGRTSKSRSMTKNHVDVNLTSLLCHPEMLSSSGKEHHCIHHRPSPSYVGDLAESFLDAYYGKIHFFATFQFLNGQETTGLAARAQDHAVAQVLDKLVHQQMLSRTIVLLYSEHSLYKTLDLHKKSPGDHPELLNPAAFLLLPESYIHQRPEVDQALLDNEQALVTPYDLHATLGDLMFSHPLGNYGNSSGKTLLQPIPRSRSCRQAAIPRHLCPCIRDA